MKPLQVTVKPLIHTTAGAMLIIVSLIDIFARDASENGTWQRCLASYKS